MPSLPHFVAVDWNGTVVPFFDRPAYPGALETLRRLRQAGVYLAVVSHAAQGTIEADVQRLGLAADEVHGCTDKAPLLLELRLRRGSGLVLGDHPADLRAAHDAELPFLQARLEGQAALPGSEGSFTDWAELSDRLLEPV